MTLEICSVNRRAKAERPVTSVSVSTRSSGSVSWCGRYRRSDAQVVAHSVELIGVQELLGLLVRELVPLELEEQQRGLDLRRRRSRTCCSRAPRSGVGVSTVNASDA